MSIEMMSQRITALQSIETRMGELAALMSDMADALSDHPDGVIIRGADTPLPPAARIRMDAISIRAAEWPTADEIQQLIADWHVEMINARKAWTGLPPDLRDIIAPPDAS